MVYQVGRPAMFDGNMFLPDTGMPINRMERRRTRLAVWLPEPLTVATWMLKSLTTLVRAGVLFSCDTTSVGDMPGPWNGVNFNLRLYRQTAQSRLFTAVPISAGLFTTVTPAAVSAAIFSAAVPLPPAMIAPACPMRRPGGAVWPAMKPTTGFLNAF